MSVAGAEGKFPKCSWCAQSSQFDQVFAPESATGSPLECVSFAAAAASCRDTRRKQLAHSEGGSRSCGSLLPPWFGEACFASGSWRDEARSLFIVATAGAIDLTATTGQTAFSTRITKLSRLLTCSSRRVGFVQLGADHTIQNVQGVKFAEISFEVPRGVMKLVRPRQDDVAVKSIDLPTTTFARHVRFTSFYSSTTPALNAGSASTRHKIYSQDKAADAALNPTRAPRNLACAPEALGIDNASFGGVLWLTTASLHSLDFTIKLF